MNKIDFSKLSLKKDFNKLLRFNFSQLLNSKIYYIFLTLLFLCQPITSIIVNYATNSFKSNSLFILLIPLIIIFLYSLFDVIKIFNENRYNYVDTCILSKPISRTSLFFTRLLTILFPLFIAQIFSAIFCAIFCFVIDESWFITPIVISDLFITPFISLLIIFIQIILCTKLKPIYFAISAFIISMLFCVPSIFSRTLINNDQPSISYNNEEYSFTKLYDGTNTYYGLTLNSKNNNVLNSLNSINWSNNIIPSEWLICFYNSLFNNCGASTELSDKLNYPYSITNNKFSQISSYYTIEKENLISFRGQDQNLPINDTKSFVNSICNTISSIDNSGKCIDLKDDKMVELFLNKIRNTYDWNDKTLQPVELATIKAITGIDTDYNQMFYLIDHFQYYKQHFKDLKEAVKRQFCSSLFDLIEYLCTNISTKYNIYETSNVMSTNKSINDIYPNLYIIDSNYKIMNSDYEFIKNILINYRNGKFYYLGSDYEYHTSESFNNNIKTLDATIVDLDGWYKYVDKISLKYQDTQTFLNKLKQFENDVYKMKLNNNKISLYKFDYILSVNNADYLKIAPIFITLISLLIPSLGYISLAIFNKSNYKEL